MLENEFIEVNLSSRNVKHYELLNYNIPKYIDKKGRLKVKNGTKIIVKIFDIPYSSHINIPVVCDYCGKIFYPTVKNYHIGHRIINKDSCNECVSEKIKDIYAGSHIKINFETVYNEFISHGLLLQIDEIQFNNTNIKESLPFICLEHSECGVQYKTYNKAKSSKFCCEYGYRSQNKGENNPRWKGGISSERDMIKHSEKYREWRKLVYQRDNYTCQCCGDNSGGNLEAHHKENFSTNEELRLDVENGVTLCNLCHNPNKYGSFHHTYGTHNNTKEQLEEYILRYKLGEFDEIRKQVS